jgi:hypothetical protein
MSEILRYRVVEATSVEQLAKQVQGELSNGWQPLGGPFLFAGSVCQAMGWPESAERVEAPIESTREETASDLELIQELTEDDEPMPNLRAGYSLRGPREVPG